MLRGLKLVSSVKTPQQHLNACVYTGMCRHFGVYLYLSLLLFYAPDRGGREKKTHISSRRIFKQSTSVPTGQKKRRQRVSTTLERNSHFGGNEIEAEQENRNIVLFHEQHKQTTVLTNQHTPGNTSRITPLSFTATNSYRRGPVPG